MFVDPGANTRTLCMQVIRVINVTVFFPLMRPTGHGMTPAAAVITAWSGLRGLVGLVLALLVISSRGFVACTETLQYSDSHQQCMNQAVACDAKCIIIITSSAV